MGINNYLQKILYVREKHLENPTLKNTQVKDKKIPQYLL